MMGGEDTKSEDSGDVTMLHTQCEAVEPVYHCGLTNWA